MQKKKSMIIPPEVFAGRRCGRRRNPAAFKVHVETLVRLMMMPLPPRSPPPAAAAPAPLLALVGPVSRDALHALVHTKTKREQNQT